MEVAITAATAAAKTRKMAAVAGGAAAGRAACRRAVAGADNKRDNKRTHNDVGGEQHYTTLTPLSNAPRVGQDLLRTCGVGLRAAALDHKVRTH